MSAAHFHLMLNHIPLLGLVFGAVLLGYGLWRGSEDVQKASLGLLAVAGLSAIAVYLTGEPAEEIVEGLAGVSHDAVEAHEEWGWYALIAGIATGVVALGTLLVGWMRERLGRGAVVLTLVVALLSSGLIGYTANLGGKISHPELRADQGGQTAPAETEHEDGEQE
jgi:MFS family permease